MTIVKMNHGYEISDTKASIKAQELLEGTISYAAAKTIRVDYRSIEKKIKNNRQYDYERIFSAVERTADRLGLLNW
jgi:mannose/fructose/N-acetylgalactosamine-specific phosphotransferase system component IIB